MSGREWWECLTEEEVDAYWNSDEAKDEFAENLLCAIERLELAGLSDRIAPRASGILDATSHFRNTFAPGIKRAIVNRKAREKA